MYGITSALKAFNDMLKSLFDYLSKSKDKQTETDVLSDKKTLKKASNAAEEIISNTEGFFAWVSDLCWDIMDFRQKRQFMHFVRRHKKLKKKFEKNN
ncbi:MAG: hypothetical protein K6C94_08995 [Candidatus Gastranaerophilales bacterium]|nr:hypothetical protein [Candidatus Gastranaerophilales bacterium]